MKRLNVLLVFGGESPEHEVSIKSAHNVYAAMDSDKYHVQLCYIDKKGKWWLIEKWIDNLEQHGGVQLLAVPGAKSLVTMPGDRILPIDVIFPVLHGKNGEDGTIQGFSEMLHIPYVGCSVESSALCMDKHKTKQVLRANDLPAVDWTVFFSDEDIRRRLDDDKKKIYKKLGKGPWFVKPSRAGSSIGVSKVNEFSKLEPAIAAAHRYDTLALVEQAVVGRELEVAVLGSAHNAEATAPGEILVGAEFYDYDDKYSASSTSQALLEVELSKNMQTKIHDTALLAYQALGCEVLARVDFLLSETNELYINEINTMPGFTNISMYPKLWHKQGLKYPQLIDRLIELALKK